jgi:opacity protein-like surface antigen
MKPINKTVLVLAIGVVVAYGVPELQAQPASPVNSSATNSPAAGPGYKAPLAGNLYVGFDLGAALQQDIALSDGVGDSEKIAFDPGARLDVQLGYCLTPNWAVELEMGFIANQVKYSYALGTDYSTVNLVELPLLLNVIYSRPLGGHFSAYVGGGVGGVFINYQDEYGDTTPTASTFGYQGMAGFRYILSRKWEIGVGYKLLGTTGYDVDSGIAYDGFTPTEYKSTGNLTQAILLTFTCRF